jgi:RNA polymerase sigma factor (sigma-70 family)
MSSSNHLAQDNDLLVKCRDNDRKAQYELYNKYSGKMYFVCLRYAEDSDQAQDILQDGFIKVFKNLDKFRGEGSFEGWIRRIFVNTAIEYIRRKIDIKSISETHEESIETKEVNGLNKLAADDIFKVIQTLPTGYKSVFNMYEIEGYSHKEIAEMLGISEGTSKSQLSRAKQMLKKELILKYPDLEHLN